MLLNTLVTLSLVLSLGTAAADEPCSEKLKSKTVQSLVRDEAQSQMENAGVPANRAKGYAILIGAMVASAAGTTYLNTLLPKDLQFLTLFIAQVSAIGVYVLGAPIWEPLSSRFRKLAFGVKRGLPTGSAPAADSHLEEQWHRTQESYSLNAQMSRNIVSVYITSVRQNFYEAYRAMNDSNPIFAADQIAEAAYRLRTLFKDVDPDDISVANAVRAAFTRHVEIDEHFIQLVRDRLRTLDPEFDSAHAHYDRVLAHWLRD